MTCILTHLRSVQHSFGSGRVGSRTGIIFNDEINDFLLPSVNPHPSGDGVPPFHFANQIFPGKRPMSSMCPTIVMNKEGRVTMVIGAAGSTLITSATAYVCISTYLRSIFVEYLLYRFCFNFLFISLFCLCKSL